MFSVILITIAGMGAIEFDDPFVGPGGLAGQLEWRSNGLTWHGPYGGAKSLRVPSVPEFQVCENSRPQNGDAPAEAQTRPAPREEEREFYPAYTSKGCEDVTSEATGFFHIRKISGRSWLIDPNGKGFYMVGADHANYGGIQCRKLGYAPYNHTCEAKYGSEDKWAEATLDRLTQWGFNTLADNNSSSMRHRRLPHTEFLKLGATFSGVDDLSPKATWTGFPNVFSPEWEPFCERTAEKLCSKLKDDPWLIGYFIDNELEWGGRNYKPLGLFDEAWMKPAGHSAKQAWVKYLEHELGSASAMQHHWGVAISDFSELARHVTPSAGLTSRAEAIAEGWVRLCAREYFQKTTDAIRKFDPNHLILGCRFAGRAPHVLDIAGDYCDVLSFNVYPRIDVERGVLESVLAKLESWYHEADVPLMVTEWCFPAVSVPGPRQKVAGMLVDTQRQRAKCYEHFQTLLFRVPFVVGSDYFMWVDEPGSNIGEALPEDVNYGLVNAQDEPYAELTGAAAAVNPRVYELHLAGKPAVAPDRSGLAPWMNRTAGEPTTFVREELSLMLGSVKLTGPNGRNAWTIWQGATPLGVFFPLVELEAAGTPRIRPDTARITAVARNARRTIVDMILSRAGQDGSGGGTSSTNTAELFESGWRFVIPSEGSWMACSCLWLRNSSSKPWKLLGIHHCVLPASDAQRVASTSLLEGMPNYYRSGAAWVNSAANNGVGCWFADEKAFRCLFWKDSQGILHSELRQVLRKTLKPGEKMEVKGPPSFVFPMLHASLTSFSDVVAEIEKTALTGK